jgi:hypothetical protein
MCTKERPTKKSRREKEPRVLAIVLRLMASVGAHLTSEDVDEYDIDPLVSPR